MSAQDLSIVTLELQHETDVVLARKRAREIAQRLRFDAHEQTRIATAVSEIARNAIVSGPRGRLEFAVAAAPSDNLAQHPQALIARITDPGSVATATDPMGSMSVGMNAARRLMDRFEVRALPDGGTEVILSKQLPRGLPVVEPREVATLANSLGPTQSIESAHEEMRIQNHELIRALEELRTQQARMAELNQELEETNRGVVALYAELDEKAASLQRASASKTSFLANMTHEFRTPVSSILNLTRLLLDRADGPLTGEQTKQVLYIQKSAEGLNQLVNDLLDIAKVEAGKATMRISEFNANDLLAGLRGSLKPLLTRNSAAVDLVFEDEPHGSNARLHTDEGKLSQILRNFISNALKYTQTGEVRVSVREREGSVIFAVADTGIGIAPADQARVFEEFEQVESALQKRVKGTGLGLPLSRKLARLLGGNVWVESAPGVGSTFYAEIPCRFPGAVDADDTVDFAHMSHNLAAPGNGRAEIDGYAGRRGAPLVLLADDEESARYLLKDQLVSYPVRIVEAADGRETIEKARLLHPDLIFLDLVMPGLSGIEVMRDLRGDESTRTIPVIIRTSKDLEPNERRAIREGAIELIHKSEDGRDGTAHKLESVMRGVLGLEKETRRG